MKTDKKKTGKPFLSVREICLFSFLGALIFMFKLVMAPLPNIEPVSLMILILAKEFRAKGLIAVVIYICLEFLIYGIALWSLAYLYVWFILYGLAYWIRKTGVLDHAILSAFFGLSFGFLCGLSMELFGGFSAFLSWWIAGIPFDLLHAAGNFTLCLLLYKPLVQIFEMMKKRWNLN